MPLALFFLLKEPELICLQEIHTDSQQVHVKVLKISLSGKCKAKPHEMSLRNC